MPFQNKLNSSAVKILCESTRISSPKKSNSFQNKLEGGISGCTFWFTGR